MNGIIKKNDQYLVKINSNGITYIDFSLDREKATIFSTNNHYDYLILTDAFLMSNIYSVIPVDNSVYYR